MCKNLTLVIGGASSGKTNIAEKLCVNSNLTLVYLATAQILDDETRTKVERHRADRGELWRTIEEPFRVDETVIAARRGEILLLDCATMWLTNHLLADHPLAAETDRLLAACARSAAEIVIVTNETGMGIVPENALARRFRIEQGTLNRRLAEHAARVIGVMAGLPFPLKGALPEGVA
ncbi:bifunctional adenosylcobinamide kinase/adenosylcobinamide-phosphate guanylyltransferase [Celeribacter indicus]|uniref:bifunctional adenosylcobinamide kinase/adenosylcobinamide-phosphate guanylyltransferase n=1 Tax=Celeribacter indicus TaxID=1208324 RepID=UPI0006943AE2|nr:bifunctional adenosylcobinamide kinase/adenosylcobinamide-phosphate guanylyltransferase [Celeribacter indicus]